MKIYYTLALLVMLLLFAAYLLFNGIVDINKNINDLNQKNNAQDNVHNGTTPVTTHNNIVYQNHGLLVTSVGLNSFFNPVPVNEIVFENKYTNNSKNTIVLMFYEYQGICCSFRDLELENNEYQPYSMSKSTFALIGFESVLTEFGKEFVNKATMQVLTLAPGESKNIRIDIGKVVDFSSPGRYLIWLDLLFRLHDGTYIYNGEPLNRVIEIN